MTFEREWEHFSRNKIEISIFREKEKKRGKSLWAEFEREKKAVAVYCSQSKEEKLFKKEN